MAPDDHTVRRVLLVLAERFDQKAAGAQGITARDAWEAAARIAREEAQDAAGAVSAPVPVSVDGGEHTEALSAARKRLGRLVREVWVDWASRQTDAKPSWLVPWGQLDAGQREVDMRIGEAVAADERERIAKLAEQHHVRYQINPCVCGDPEHWQPFADLIREQQ